MNTVKTCVRCHVEKPVDEFYSRRDRPCGRISKCKACSRKLASAWHSANYCKPEVSSDRRARSSAHYYANPDKHIDQAAKWKKDNPGRNREIQRKSDRKHAAERAKVRSAWWADNPGKRQEYQRNVDPERERIRCANRRARIKLVGGTLSPNLVDELMAAQRGKCMYCPAHLSKTNRHLDHIVPLNRGGPNVDANCQLLCVKCNCSKKDRDPVEFMRSRGLVA